MTESIALTEFKQGVRLLRDSQPDNALEHFRKAVDLEQKNPYYISFTGLALARAQRKWDAAVKLCELALTMKRNEVQLHLNLAQVYSSAGRREEALITLERAEASLGPHPRIRQERQKLGRRQSPALPFLDRQNFLNKYLGMLRHRLFARANGSASLVLHSS